MPRVMQKGQVVIPVRLRRRYSLAPGTTVAFEPTRKGVLVKPATDIVRELTGKYRGFGSTAELIADRREEVRREERKFKKFFSK